MRPSIAPLALAALLGLVGCTGKSGDSNPAGSSDDTAADLGPQPAPLTTLSDSECPDFSEPGSSKFSSNGQERQVITYWPESRAQDLPVVFVWHPLGGTARNMVTWLDLENYADDVGAIVVVPNSLDSNPFEWDFWNGGTDDLTMYDDLRTCVSQEFGANLRKVSSTGMSAGALWTTWLSIERGDTLSTILPFSGGTEPVVEYATPASQFPALINYGGETDQFDGGGATVDFTQTTVNFSNELYADGHEVVLCNHNLGHTIPPEGREMMDAWLTTQTYGEPNTVDLAALPEYCMTYDGSLTASQD